MKKITFGKRKANKANNEQTGSMNVHSRATIFSLPEEVALHLLSFLNPNDLSRFSQTCRQFRIYAYHPSLWKEIHPLHWAIGDWCRKEVPKDVLYRDLPYNWKHTAGFMETFTIFAVVMHTSSTLINNLLRPMKLFGCGVRVLNFSHTEYLTQSSFNRVIKLCPNVEEIDIRCPDLTSGAFYRVWDAGAAKRLSKLTLVNCKNLTDTSLLCLVRCWVKDDQEFMKLDLTEGEKKVCCKSPREIKNVFDFQQSGSLKEGSKDNSMDGDTLSRSTSECVGLKKLNLCGAICLTNQCFRYLALSPNVTMHLEDLDVSGCPCLTGEAMINFVQKCPRIRGDQLTYCSYVNDGPHQSVANGCDFCANLQTGLCATLADI